MLGSALRGRRAAALRERTGLPGRRRPRRFAAVVRLLRRARVGAFVGTGDVRPCVVVPARRPRVSLLDAFLCHAPVLEPGLDLLPRHRVRLAVAELLRGAHHHRRLRRRGRREAGPTGRRPVAAVVARLCAVTAGERDPPAGTRAECQRGRQVVVLLAHERLQRDARRVRDSTRLEPGGEPGDAETRAVVVDDRAARRDRRDRRVHKPTAVYFALPVLVVPRVSRLGEGRRAVLGAGEFRPAPHRVVVGAGSREKRAGSRQSSRRGVDAVLLRRQDVGRLGEKRHGGRGVRRRGRRRRRRNPSRARRRRCLGALADVQGRADGLPRSDVFLKRYLPRRRDAFLEPREPLEPRRPPDERVQGARGLRGRLRVRHTEETLGLVVARRAVAAFRGKRRRRAGSARVSRVSRVRDGVRPRLLGRLLRGREEFLKGVVGVCLGVRR